MCSPGRSSGTAQSSSARAFRRGGVADWARRRPTRARQATARRAGRPPTADVLATRCSRAGRSGDRPRVACWRPRRESPATASAAGPLPTGIVATTEPVAGVDPRDGASRPFATQTASPTTATAVGPVRRAAVVTASPDAGSISSTVPSSYPATQTSPRPTATADRAQIERQRPAHRARRGVDLDERAARSRRRPTAASDPKAIADALAPPRRHRLRHARRRWIDALDRAAERGSRPTSRRRRRDRRPARRRSGSGRRLAGGRIDASDDRRAARVGDPERACSGGDGGGLTAEPVRSGASPNGCRSRQRRRRRPPPAGRSLPPEATSSPVAAATAASAAAARHGLRGAGARRGAGAPSRVGSCRRIRCSSSRSCGPGSRPSSSDEPMPTRLHRGQSIRLAAGAVERQHQLAEQPLAERVLVDKPLELGNERRAACRRASSASNGPRRPPAAAPPAAPPRR